MGKNNTGNGGSLRYCDSAINHVKSLIYICVLLVISFGLSGCITLNDPEASQEFNSDLVGTLDPQTSLGQTFYSRRPLLNGITLWLKPIVDLEAASTPRAPSIVEVLLFHSSADSLPFYKTAVQAPTTAAATPVSIDLSGIGNQAGESFYLRLSVDSGAIGLMGRNEDAYPYGEAFHNDQPLKADFAFRLTYEYDGIALSEDVRNIIGNCWLILPLGAILYLPGWLLLDIAGIKRRFDSGEIVAISVGISLALIPLVMLWTSILKFEWTRNRVLFVTGFLVALLIIRIGYKYFSSRQNIHNKINNPEGVPRQSIRHGSKICSGYLLALTLVFLFSLAIRLIMVRDLATPAWVDSVHHALITRLIMSTGMYPTSYQPYLDINPADYHPGFHSVAAGFTWLSELQLQQSLLILGQVLNAFMVFSVYLFTNTLTRNSPAGLIAAVITGCLTPMPAYYTSWGRYTELTGLIILPAAFALLLLFNRPHKSKQTNWIIFLSAITAGGLFLVHYRVAAFLIMLIIAYLLINIRRWKNEVVVNGGIFLKNGIIFISLSIILVIPWLVQMLRETVIPALSVRPPSEIPFFQDFSWAFLTTAYGKQALVLAGLGLLWGIIKGKRFTFLLLVWIFLLFLVANLGAIELPGGGMISTSSVEIMLFMPISVLGGYFFSQLITSWKAFLPRKHQIPFYGLVYTMVAAGAILGARQLIPIINSVTILSRSADLPAIEWLKANIPQDETIVINPFSWGYGIFAGADGGYWISPLTGNETLPPPVLYGLGDEVVQINQQIQQIIDSASNPAALAEFLKSNHMSTIFIGEKGGVISPASLSESGLFEPLYDKDGVWIFQLKP